MSTLTTEAPTVGQIDLSTTPRIPLSRLVKVELRKLADTRSGLWMLVLIGALTLVVIAAYFVTTEQSERTFFHFMAAANGPQGLLLPVLGILLVTSEWSQRTAMVSFTLTPARTRVLVAKVVAGLLAGAGALVLTVAVARWPRWPAGQTTPGRPSGPTTPASSSCSRAPGCSRDSPSACCS